MVAGEGSSKMLCAPLDPFIVFFWFPSIVISDPLDQDLPLLFRIKTAPSGKVKVDNPAEFVPVVPSVKQ
ncbi:hypothetical protein [Segatella copri]|uniref:hypothetical protein n=1 Tax=Segatella copri TaxID=165179 RepID=UPI00129241C4|nr:hypothetical protein [Segatella copri]MQM89155.1 hypothetical protein [Segatella copri]MQM96919.1 hypothetical protein [Segatella copri]MQN04212.1 hypothetical protein [Segatella copri]MQN17418.1 hypothetical protein [Segatella copri]MQO37196.1 hypothetical protein [Segatella copri]